MTKFCTSSNPLPFLLKPAGKDYIWGGERLKAIYHKQIDMNPLAETWECSTHKDGLSIVASGEYEGLTLRKLLFLHPELTGRIACPDGELPILIKFIDAQNDLSIQVHPDDAYAREYESDSLGKSEMWYVIDAKENARLVYGFNQNVTREQIKQSVINGTLSKYLQYVNVKKNDVFEINPGQVHAIGAGVLVAEIQENSNITYRLYDYNRTDKNGNMRALHLDKALEVANLNSSVNPRQPMRLLSYKPGFASELLCRCKYYQVERLLLNSEKPIFFEDKNNSFCVYLVTEGACKIRVDSVSDFELNINPGDCIFVPANVPTYNFTGNCQLLKIEC